MAVPTASSGAAQTSSRGPLAPAAKKKKKKQPAKTSAKKKTKKTKLDPYEGALYQPGKTLAGVDLVRAAKALVEREFKPQESALERQAQTVERQGTALSQRASDHYRTIAEREAGAIARQQALSARAGAQLESVDRDSKAALNRAVDDATRAADETARTTGVVTPREQLTSEMAAAQSRQAQTSQAFRSAGTLQSAGSEDLLSAIGQARQLRGGEVQQQLLNRALGQRADVEAKKAEISSLRGPALTKALLELRQVGFENVATMRGLNLKEADLTADIAKTEEQLAAAERKEKEAKRHNRESEKNTRRGQDVTARGQDITSRDKAAARAAKGGKKGLTQTQRTANAAKYDKAVGLLAGAPKNRKEETSQRLFLQSKGIPAWIAQAAVQTHVYGGVYPRTLRELKKRYGFGSRLPKRSGQRGNLFA